VDVVIVFQVLRGVGHVHDEFRMAAGEVIFATEQCAAGR